MPWLKKTLLGLFGQEDADFTNIILGKLAQRQSAEKMYGMVEKVLHEDTESFIVKMWRNLIFEILKIKYDMV